MRRIRAVMLLALALALGVVLHITVTSSEPVAERVQTASRPRSVVEVPKQSSTTITSTTTTTAPPPTPEPPVAARSAAKAIPAAPVVVEAPSPTPPPTPAPRASGGPTPEQLAELRQCESGGNYQANTGNGYYGAYQFLPSTWRSMNTGYDMPHTAPPEVQDDAAYRLIVRSGWGQFPACARKMGMR